MNPKCNHVHLLLLKTECAEQLRARMVHVKLIKGEKGMLELKGGGSIQIHTEEKNESWRELVERGGEGI